MVIEEVSNTKGQGTEGNKNIYEHIFSQEATQAIFAYSGMGELTYSHSEQTREKIQECVRKYNIKVIQKPSDIYVVSRIHYSEEVAVDRMALQINYTKSMTHEELCQRTDVLVLSFGHEGFNFEEIGQITLKLTYV